MPRVIYNGKVLEYGYVRKTEFYVRSRRQDENVPEKITDLDAKLLVQLLFEDGKEIISFDSNNPEDLRDKVLYYLEHEQEREAIAHQGYVRTMNENTWLHRVKGFLNFVKENQ